MGEKMIPIKDVVTLFESNVRIKILIIAWLITLFLLFVNISLRWLPFTALSIWGIVEIVYALNEKSRAKNAISAAVSSNHALDPKNVFEGLSPQALKIIQFWLLPGNRFKTQNLDSSNDDVQALERATVIEEEYLAYDTEYEDCTYKISNWAATFLEAHPESLNRLNRMNLSEIDLKNIVVEYLKREKPREHFLHFEELDKKLSFPSGSSKRVIADAAKEASYDIRSLGDKTVHLKKRTAFMRT